MNQTIPSGQSHTPDSVLQSLQILWPPPDHEQDPVFWKQTWQMQSPWYFPSSDIDSLQKYPGHQTYSYLSDICYFWDVSVWHIWDPLTKVTLTEFFLLPHPL